MHHRRVSVKSAYYTFIQYYTDRPGGAVRRIRRHLTAPTGRSESVRVSNTVSGGRLAWRHVAHPTAGRHLGVPAGNGGSLARLPGPGPPAHKGSRQFTGLRPSGPSTAGTGSSEPCRRSVGKWLMSSCRRRHLLRFRAVLTPARTCYFAVLESALDSTQAFRSDSSLTHVTITDNPSDSTLTQLISLKLF